MILHRVGADLAFVFTAQEAAIPLKCYGPELMVLPMYSVAEFDLAASSEEREQLVARGVAKVKEALSRVHALLIGPGLGRHPQVWRRRPSIGRAWRDGSRVIVYPPAP